MRAILFDFGGTLDSPRHWLDRFLSHYRSAGVDISRDELDAAYGAATRKAYRASEGIREFGLRELVGYLVDLQFSTLREIGTPIIRRYLEERAGRIKQSIKDGFAAESIQGLEQSREVLSRLAVRFKIGVVSNFYGNLDRVLTEAKLKDLMAVVVDSSRVGILKPDSRIFQVALADLESPAAEAAFVGDSLDKDCAPARRLGMRTVWLRAGDAASGELAQGLADYTIHRLDEVEDIQW